MVGDERQQDERRTPVRLLLIEPDSDDASRIAAALEAGGVDAEIVRVDGHATAAAALSRRQFDAVLSCHALPGFSGGQALELVQAQAGDLPFLLVSGTVTPQGAVAAMRAGAHDFVGKDDLSRLAPALLRELREAEVRRERARVTEALRGSEERYRRIIEAMPMGVHICWLDGDGTLTLAGANRTADELLGLTHAPHLGEPLEALLPHITGTEVPARLALLARQGGQWTTRQHPCPAPGGRCRLESFNYQSAPGEVVTLFRDVSAQAKLEEQLRGAVKMEAVGQLAGGVAHDFNNLLAVILTCAEFALDELPEADPLRADLLDIRQAAERAAALTRQLLAFSRRQVLEPLVHNLNDTVERLEKMLRRLIGEHISLETRLADGLGAVRADPGQIEQVIMNLAVNARDAMPEGGRLLIETGDAELDAAFVATHPGASEGPAVRLSLVDDGVGMDPATLRRIFEPFFTTKEAGKGTGLGLSTVYGIVKQSGGGIWAESTPGAGTRFDVYLPRVLDRESLDEVVGVGPAPRQWAGHETVLVVEDDDAVRRVAARTLRRGGYTVLDARGAAEATRQARGHQGPIAVLLSDVVMPETAGPGVAAQVRALRPDIAVLFMTGYTDDTVLRLGELGTSTRLLHKPFTSEALLRAVRLAIDARR